MRQAMSAVSDAGTPPLVGPDWLASRLKAPGIAILDGSWYLPDMGRDAAAEYRAGHIPGAVFADLDALSLPDTPLPHMLARPADFARDMGAMGVASSDHVVIYDGAGLFSAPRFWWMFRAMGHERVSVLDGGLPAWRAAGLPLAQGIERRPPSVFTACLRPALIADKAALAANLAGGSFTVLDARSPGRFHATEPEPRPGLRGGHIPGSRNVPYRSVLGPDGRLKSPEALRALFGEAGIALDRPIVTSCGSGVTAAILALALAVTGVPDVPVYDGSWAEWGADPALPVQI